MSDRQQVIKKWLENKIKGKKWDDYFNSYGYNNLTIYGAGDLGKYLVWELKNSDIKINCILDRRANEIKRFETKEVYTLDEFLKRNIDTDVIVVTALSAYNNILYTMAEKKIEVPVMNLGDIVFEL